MIDLELDFDELALRTINGIEAGLINVRVYVAADYTGAWSIDGLAIDGWQPMANARPRFQYINLDHADPLYPILLEAVIRGCSQRITDAVEEKIAEFHAARFETMADQKRMERRV